MTQDTGCIKIVHERNPLNMTQDTGCIKIVHERNPVSMTHFQHGHYLPHMECPKYIRIPAVHFAACQLQPIRLFRSCTSNIWCRLPELGGNRHSGVLIGGKKSLNVMSGELAGRWDGETTTNPSTTTNPYTTTNPSVLQGRSRAPEWRHAIFLEQDSMLQYLKLWIHKIPRHV